MPVTRGMPVTDQRMQRLLASVSAEDAAETDLARMSSAVQVVLDGGRAVAAAGYLTWPGGVAHLSVLTDTARRGRGLAKLAGSLATADALARGLLPQWRARVPASPEPGRRRYTTAGEQHRPGGLAIGAGRG